MSDPFENRFKNLEAAIDRCIKTLLLPLDDPLDVRLPFPDLGKLSAHREGDGGHYLEDKRILHAEVPAEARRTAEDTAHDVAAPLVRRQSSVGNREGEHADVVGDDTHGHAGFPLLM